VYSAAALLYVLAVTYVVMTGVPNLVDGILAERVEEPVREFIGLVAALALAALTVGPFVGEVRAARAEKLAG
jgi:hypothetical protein